MTTIPEIVNDFLFLRNSGYISVLLVLQISQYIYSKSWIFLSLTNV